MTSFYNEHSKVWVSVDCIVFGFDEGKLRLLIGRRKMNPGCGEWSLYGGFVGPEESLDEAARRVLYELTGLKELFMKQVGAFGKIDRDPGDRVISVAYCALIEVKKYDHELCEKHDVQWVDIDSLPVLYSDHNEMVHNAIVLLRNLLGSEAISYNLLPESFTLTQLQEIHEAILGHAIDKRNFRKKMKDSDILEPTGEIDKETSRRGAALYRFSKQYNVNDN